MKPTYEELEAGSDEQADQMVGANKTNMAIAAWNKNAWEDAQ